MRLMQRKLAASKLLFLNAILGSKPPIRTVQFTIFCKHFKNLHSDSFDTLMTTSQGAAKNLQNQLGFHTNYSHLTKLNSANIKVI